MRGYLEYTVPASRRPARQTPRQLADAQGPRVYTPEQVAAAVREQGYNDWILSYSFVPPSGTENTFVYEAARARRSGNSNVERRFLCFSESWSSSRNEYKLVLSAIYTEAEYVSYLRNRRVGTEFFYRAIADGRRRMVAKVLAAGEPVYQLYLPAVVDDDELRSKLTTRKYRKSQLGKSKSREAATRMGDFRRQLFREVSELAEASPEPHTSRGQRAAVAAERRLRDQGVRREELFDEEEDTGDDYEPEEDNHDGDGAINSSWAHTPTLQLHSPPRNR